MTHCDFSARVARDEMRHIIGGSESDIIIRSDKDQNSGCKARTKMTWNSCGSCTKRKRRAVATSCTS